MKKLLFLLGCCLLLLGAAAVPVSAGLRHATPAADTTPPTVTATGFDARWHNHPVNVSLAATDAESGVAFLVWSPNDDPNWYQIMGAGGQVTVPAPADHTWDGDNVIWYSAQDNAGNYPDPVTTNCSVKIDTRKPTTKAPYAVSVVRSRGTIKCKVVDGAPNGGTAAVTIRVKNRAGKVVGVFRVNDMAVNVMLTIKISGKLPKGTHTYFVYAKDAAGNAQASVGSNKLVVK